MAQTQNNAAALAARGQAGAQQQNPATRGRIVILNALPLNAMPQRHMQLDVIPVSMTDLVQWVQRRLQEGFQLIHYIRHPATIAALRAAGVPLQEQPNAGLYAYQPSDVIVVVTLRNPPRGQEVVQVFPQDLEAWIVAVI
jgi:hypothetical protein